MGGQGARSVVCVALIALAAACSPAPGVETRPPTTVALGDPGGSVVVVESGTLAAKRWQRPEVDSDQPGAIRIEPGTGIQSVVDGHPPGTTFVLATGVHRSQSITPRTGDVFLGEAGAVLDGEYALEYAISWHDVNNPVRGVVIRGLVFERYATPLQQGTIGGGGGVDWLIEGNEVRLSRGGGIEIGSGSRVIDNYVHDNEQIGLHIGSPTVGVLVEGNEIAFNNREGLHDMAWEAGGAKFVMTRDLTVRGNYVHDNMGPGLWTDGDNVGTLYEGNVVAGNVGPGIFHEISYEATIRDNLVEGNAFGFYFGGILISSSRGVEVTGNTVRGNNGGIAAVQDDRGMGEDGPYHVGSLLVRGNTIAHVAGWTGVLDNVGDGEVFDREISFSSNRYEVPEGAEAWMWEGGLLDGPGWLAAHPADG
jgi:hypothetical protein